MRILLADDYELVRNGVSRIIEDEFSDAVIANAGCGIQAEESVRSGNWDLVVMDMFMPDKSGLDVLKQLRSEGNLTPILIFSIHPESQYAMRVLKSGGNGYISKDCSHVDFIKALNTVLSGKKYISSLVAEKLASGMGNNHKEAHELISDRELQVLKLIASGKTVSEIAELLLLKVPTVSTYRQRLLEKMTLKNNAELTLYAISNKLV